MNIHDEIRVVKYFTHNLLVSENVASELAYELARRGFGFACAPVPAGPVMFHLSKEATDWVVVWSEYARPMPYQPYELEDADRPFLTKCEACMGLGTILQPPKGSQ